jgi:ureidoglycolate lyase
MAEICITALALTREAFLKFGDVIETGSAREIRTINDGNTRRFHDLANVQLAKGKSPLVNIFRSTPLSLPLQIRKMECHPHSSQLFFPLDAEPYLVVVADAGVFMIENIRAFMASPKQGILYRAGTWHHYSIALREISDFLVLDGEDLPGNCEEVQLQEVVYVNLSSGAVPKNK